jgi:ComF family protein
MYLFYRAFWDKIWPRACITCGHELVLLESNLCSTCTDAVLEAQLRYQDSLPLLDSLSCWLDFDIPTVQKMLHQLKFGQTPEMGFQLGVLYAQLHPRPLVDALIPAPLSQRRQWQRGYNQSDWIVKGLSRTWSLPIWNVLHKSHRPPQAKLNKHARTTNVCNAYRLKRPIPARCRVQIWDDTLTTGATLQAMAQVLFQGGASEVHGATLARAL